MDGAPLFCTHQHKVEIHDELLLYLSEPGAITTALDRH